VDPKQRYNAPQIVGHSGKKDRENVEQKGMRRNLEIWKY